MFRVVHHREVTYSLLKAINQLVSFDKRQSLVWTVMYSYCKIIYKKSNLSWILFRLSVFIWATEIIMGILINCQDGFSSDKPQQLLEIPVIISNLTKTLYDHQ